MGLDGLHSEERFGRDLGVGSPAPFRPVTIRSICADGDTVIVLWDGRGIAIDGQPYEDSYAWFRTLREGKVIGGTAFYASISFNDRWAWVQP